MEGQEYKGVLKLQGKPQQVEITIGGSKFKCWMHPLTGRELQDVEAVEMEAFRSFKERGADVKDASWKSVRVGQCQQLFYVLKKSADLDAERVLTEMEAIIIPTEETNRLMKVYSNFFVPTVDEIKNCLRERLGQDSETSSISPNDSDHKSSSRKALSKAMRT